MDSNRPFPSEQESAAGDSERFLGIAHPAHEDDDHHDQLSPSARIWQLISAERKDIGVVILFAMGVGLLTLATPIAVQGLVNSVAFGGLLQPIIVLAVILFTCLAFAAALTGLQWWLVEVLQRRIFVRVVAELAQRLPRVRAEAFDREHGPELVNRFFDVLTVQKVIASLLLDGVALTLQAGISMILLAFYHPYLLGFDLMMLATLAFLVFGLGRGAASTSIAESRAKYAVAGWLEELARHPIAFKTSGGPEFALRRVDVLASSYIAARRAHFRVLMRQIIFALAAQVVTSTLLLGLGGWLVIQGQLTLGQLVAAELMVAVIVGAFTKLGKHLEGYYDLMAAVNKLGRVVDLPLESATGEVREKEPRPAGVKFCDVSFAFAGAKPLFSGLNWQIEPGERVVISAPAGTGKSTLADLLFGMRWPTQGHLELDGIALGDLRLSTLREQVAVVKQVEIFAGTVLENVQLARPGVNTKEVRAALEAVGLLDDLQSLSGGLGTRLTPGGSPLSASQSMLLMIARAIAGAPRLLVLDESLDALDERDRAIAMRAVCDRRQPWTLILITRLGELAGSANRVLRLSPADDNAEKPNPRQLPAEV